ncbi:MAG: NADH-quinone oxidoreductase subunit N [Verrucomicrobiota bacterium]
MSVPYAELLSVFRPEIALVLGAFLALTFDLLLGRRQTLAQRTLAATTLGLIALAAAACFTQLHGAPGPAFQGTFILDSLGLATRLGVLVLAALTLALLPGNSSQPHPAEYVALILFATAGFTLMAVAQQLLVAFLALELASLSLYILAGFDKTRRESAEAALKYFLVGGIAAAFLLFGFSLLYGLTGSIALPEISRQLGIQNLTTLHLVALAMIVVAFGFKAAAAPFHLWAPDVYQGAPAPSAALIASASKLAGLVLFTRLFWSGAAPAAGSVATIETVPGWLPLLALVALASLLLGNFAALAQANLRRLLAYSAIAHAGALLLGVMAAGRDGPAPLFYYAATYGLATIGTFGVIAVLDGHDPAGPRCQNLSDLAGLHRRSPLLAGCLAIFILSLAGIPPLAGFFGKFAVFAAALKLGAHSMLGWLTFLAIAFSAVALYYYLLILKQAFVADASAERAARVRVPLPAATALLLAAALLILLGIFPSLLLRLV